MNIPFVDLGAQYDSIKDEIDAAIARVIRNTAFIGGESVRTFEREFAAACGRSHCVGVGNGTDAIYIVLRMLGIGPGDEVLVPAMTWIATSEAVSQTGATPVFVDIDPEFLTMDPDELETLRTSRTRAMIPVHLYGQAADMPAITEWAERHDIHVIEDTAQAHLSRIAGKTVGSWGVAATFSFYPSKNLGAYGDAGAVVSSDHELADRIRKFANHGQAVKHDHVMEGINSRLDGIQAAILSAKLPHLESWIERRRSIAERYRAGLSGIDGLALPTERPDSRHTYHLFVVRSSQRDALRAHLEDAGIGTLIQYPTALPGMPLYAQHPGNRGTYPVAHDLAATGLSLPMYPELGFEQVDRVCNVIREFHA